MPDFPHQPPKAVRDSTPPPVPSPRTDGGRVLTRIAVGAAALLASLWVLIYWVEAEKELRVLCSMAVPGKDAAEIHRMFSTGNLLGVRTAEAGAVTTLYVSSGRNLGLSGCTVALAAGAVTEVEYRERVHLPSVATGAALAGLAWLVVLQALLASGAPLGRMAWGGAHVRLPARFRVASGVSALALAVGAVCVAQVAGLVALSGVAMVAEGVVGVLTLLFLLSIFGNLASASGRERWTGTPVAFLLACSGVVILLGG